MHQYARGVLQRGDKQEALRIWELNAKRFGTAWPVNVGLARGYSAVGRYKDALKYAKLALAQAPDELNKKSLEDAVKMLEAGATRLGTSSGLWIMQQARSKVDEAKGSVDGKDRPGATRLYTDDSVAGGY